MNQVWEVKWDVNKIWKFVNNSNTKLLEMEQHVVTTWSPLAWPIVTFARYIVSCYIVSLVFFISSDIIQRLPGVVFIIASILLRILSPSWKIQWNDQYQCKLHSFLFGFGFFVRKIDFLIDLMNESMLVLIFFSFFTWMEYAWKRYIVLESTCELCQHNTKWMFLYFRRLCEFLLRIPTKHLPINIYLDSEYIDTKLKHDMDMIHQSHIKEQPGQQEEEKKRTVTISNTKSQMRFACVAAIELNCLNDENAEIKWMDAYSITDEIVSKQKVTLPLMKSSVPITWMFHKTSHTLYACQFFEHLCYFVIYSYHLDSGKQNMQTYYSESYKHAACLNNYFIWLSSSNCISIIYLNPETGALSGFINHEIHFFSSFFLQQIPFNNGLFLHMELNEELEEDKQPSSYFVIVYVPKLHQQTRIKTQMYKIPTEETGQLSIVARHCDWSMMDIIWNDSTYPLDLSSSSSSSFPNYSSSLLSYETKRKDIELSEITENAKPLYAIMKPSSLFLKSSESQVVDYHQQIMQQIDKHSVMRCSCSHVSKKEFETLQEILLSSNRLFHFVLTKIIAEYCVHICQNPCRL